MPCLVDVAVLSTTIRCPRLGLRLVTSTPVSSPHFNPQGRPAQGSNSGQEQGGQGGSPPVPLELLVEGFRMSIPDPNHVHVKVG